jgi:orotidine-5'-phosphate decarboxylase
VTKQELFESIKKKRSFLCIGLDTDIKKIPKHFFDFADPVFEFNKQIIDATRDLCVAYKPNTAFYECNGAKGWDTLHKTIAYIGKDIFTIADAKRGDIGNTSSMYARAFFEEMSCDSVTVAPYMGEDSVKPFLEYPNKWVILLALTSNQGSADFQTAQVSIQTSSGETETRMLFEQVLRTSREWGSEENMMYVVGATQAPLMLEAVRRIVPGHFLLVPGIGAQGGSLEDVARFGMNKECGLLVNASRSILYADSTPEAFAIRAREEAEKLQKEMAEMLEMHL